MIETVTRPLLGGILIGFAVSSLLFLNGRIAGVSGILNGVLTPLKTDTAWRVAFLLGLVSGGIVLYTANPEFFANSVKRPVPVIVTAGFLVGFGTVMGSGCTSGHGVCGMSRLSPRSIVATVIFILSGMLSVAAYKAFIG